jgi:hypothetical protein
VGSLPALPPLGPEARAVLHLHDLVAHGEHQEALLLRVGKHALLNGEGGQHPYDGEVPVFGKVIPEGGDFADEGGHVGAAQAGPGAVEKGLMLSSRNLDTVCKCREEQIPPTPLCERGALAILLEGAETVSRVSLRRTRPAVTA